MRVEILERNTIVSFNGGSPFGMNAVIPRGGEVRLTVFNFEG